MLVFVVVCRVFVGLVFSGSLGKFGWVFSFLVMRFILGYRVFFTLFFDDF